MIRKTMRGIAAFIVAIAAISMAYAQRSVGIAIQDGLRRGTQGVADTFNNFVSGGYYSYQKGFDFIILFFLFMAVIMIGLKAWMKENNRQVAVIAIVIALMSSLSIVLGTDFSVVYLLPFAKLLLGLVLVIVVYSLLLKAGMQNKFLAFMLAVIITMIVFFFVGTVGSPSFRALSFTDKLGSLFTSSQGTIPRGGEGDVVSAEICKETFAFGKNDAVFKDSASGNDFLNRCIGPTVVISGYRSQEEQAGIDSQRAKAVYEALDPYAHSTLRLVPDGKGATWSFSGGEPEKKTEEEYAPNRIVVAECQCAPETADSDTFYDNWAPKSCKDLIEPNIYNQMYSALEKADELRAGYEGEPQEVRNMKEEWDDALKKCQEEYSKDRKNLNMEDLYYRAVLKYHSQIGQAYFDSTRYDKAQEQFVKIGNVIPISSKYYVQAKNAYYNMLLARYNEDHAEIMKRGGTELGTMNAKIRKLLDLRYQIKNGAQESFNENKWHTYEPVNFDDWDQNKNN